MMYQHDIASMREDARKAGLAEGLAEGRSEGAAQEKREIAKSMKAKNIPTADIAEITSGSRELLVVRRMTGMPFVCGESPQGA